MADSSFPASLNPARGAFQLLRRSVVGGKATQASNGKLTLATKAKRIKDQVVRGILVYADTDLASIPFSDCFRFTVRQVCGRLFDTPGRTRAHWVIYGCFSLCRVRSRRPVQVAARYVDVSDVTGWTCAH